MIKWFFVLFFSPQILQAQSFHLSCLTPTTTVQIWTEGDYLISQVRHPYGAHFTPFYKGSVSVFQIPELTKKAERQRELSDFQEVQWSLDNCKIQAPYKISCHSGKIIRPADGKLRAVSLETSVVITEMVNGSYRGLQFSLGLNDQGNSHQMTSDFSLERHCR